LCVSHSKRRQEGKKKRKKVDEEEEEEGMAHVEIGCEGRVEREEGGRMAREVSGVVSLRIC